MRSSPDRRCGIARIVIVATTFLALAACVSWMRPPASAEMFSSGPSATDRALRLYLTGDSAGYLGPCGCETNQYGGFPRRAAYLHAVRQPGDLAVDLGNLVTGDTLTHEIGLRYSLDALRTLSYDVFVPAEAEIRFGAVFEEAVAARPGLPVISANLLRAADGSRVFEPWLLHRLADGRAIAVVGVAEPFPDAPAQYRIAPLDETVRGAVAELRGKVDAIVVAGGLRADTTLALAAAFPEVTLVAGGWATEGPRHVVTTAGAPVLLLGEFAWYVTRVDLSKSLTVSGSAQAWLDDVVPDDPDMAALVARYKAETSQEGAGFAEKLVGTLREQSYVGSESCASCHAAEFAAWKASAHSHAMRTLVEKKAAADPQCVACHLVDVPASPAVPSPTDSLGIGCEACHGGAARHVDLAKRGSSDAGRALAPATRAACLRCHVPPNATHFDFDADWPKIAHGRPRAR